MTVMTKKPVKKTIVDDAPTLYGAPWWWEADYAPITNVPPDNGYISYGNMWRDTTTNNVYLCINSGDYQNNGLAWIFMFTITDSSFGQNIVQNTVTTLDDTQTMAVTYNVPQNSSALIVTRVIGADPNQNTIVIEQRYVVKCQTGNCSIVGSPITVINQADNVLSSAAAVLNVNGSSVEIDVTGIASTTISWAARMDVIYLT